MNKKNLLPVLIVFLSVMSGLILGNLLANRANLRSKSTFGSFSGEVEEIIKLMNCCR